MIVSDEIRAGLLLFVVANSHRSFFSPMISAHASVSTPHRTEAKLKAVMENSAFNEWVCIVLDSVKRLPDTVCKQTTKLGPELNTNLLQSIVLCDAHIFGRRMSQNKYEATSQGFTYARLQEALT